MASWQVGGMSRTRHYRDLIAWQKAMELARLVYTTTEEFPKSETFGLRMQLRRSAVNVASHIAEAHGRLNDVDLAQRVQQLTSCKRRRNWRQVWDSLTMSRVRNCWTWERALPN
jgi:four helix bundle protein